MYCVLPAASNEEIQEPLSRPQNDHGGGSSCGLGNTVSSDVQPKPSTVPGWLIPTTAIASSSHRHTGRRCSDHQIFSRARGGGISVQQEGEQAKETPAMLAREVAQLVLLSNALTLSRAQDSAASLMRRWGSRFCVFLRTQCAGQSEIRCSIQR